MTARPSVESKRASDAELHHRLLIVLGMLATAFLYAAALRLSWLSPFSLGWISANAIDILTRWGIPAVFMSFGARGARKTAPDMRRLVKVAFYLLCALLAAGCLYHVLDGQRDPVAILRLLLAGRVNYHLYPLIYAVCVVAALPVFDVFARHADKPTWVWLLALGFSVPALCSFAISQQSRAISAALNVLSYGMYFALGRFMAIFPLKRGTRGSIYALSMLGAVATFIANTFVSQASGVRSSAFLSPGQPGVIAMTVGVFTFAGSVVHRNRCPRRAQHIASILAPLAPFAYLLYDIAFRALTRFTTTYVFWVHQSLTTPLYVFLFAVIALAGCFGLAWIGVSLWARRIWILETGARIVRGIAYAVKSALALLRRACVKICATVVHGVISTLMWISLPFRNALSKADPFDHFTVRRYLLCSFAIFTTLFIVFVFGPAYVAKSTNVRIPAFFAAELTLLLIGVSMALGVPALFIGRSYKYVEITLFALMALCFVNAAIFPFSGTVYDGSLDPQSVQNTLWPLLRNAITFLLLLAVIMLIRSHVRFLAIPVLVFCAIVTMQSVLPYMSDRNENREKIMADASRFSSKRNVIIIGIDMLQGSFAEIAAEEYPGLESSFDGFTAFTRAFSSFPFTNYSEPTIFSGKEYCLLGQGAIPNYMAAFRDSFMMDLKNNGVDMNTLGFGSILSSEVNEILPGIGTSTQGALEKLQQYHKVNSTSFKYSFSFLASITRIFGYVMDNPFYSSVDLSKYDSMTQLKLNSAGFYDEILENLSVTDEQDEGLFIWDYSVHDPAWYYADGSLRENAAYYALTADLEEIHAEYSRLIQFFDALKAAGVYDNSLIIIVSDHGHFTGKDPTAYTALADFPDMYETYGNFRGVFFYNASLFIKPPYRRGDMKITYADAWVGDVRAIVNDYWSDFSNRDPLGVVAKARSEKPMVKILARDKDPSPQTEENVQASDKWHETLEVGSLYDFPAAFKAKYGTGEAK